MTVETTDNRVVYPADGVKINFVFNYKVYEAKDIVVKEDGVETTANVLVILNADQENSPGGSVNVTPAIAAPIIVSVERILDLTQPFDYQVGGSFPSASHERALDRQVMILQQQIDVLARAVRADETEDITGVNLELPAPAVRANRFIAFDASGNLVTVDGTLPDTVPISPYMQTLMPSLDDVAARSVLVSPGNNAQNLFTNNNTFEGPVNDGVTSGGDAYTVTLSPVITVYKIGALFSIFFAIPNGSVSPTIDIDNRGVTPLIRSDGTALEIGDLDGSHQITYDGTSFRVFNVIPRGQTKKGTWSPALVSLGGGGGGIPSNIETDYIVVEGTCLFTAKFEQTKGSMNSGSLVITSLPFPAIKNGGGVTFSYADNLLITNGESITGSILSGETQIRLQKWSDTQGAVDFDADELGAVSMTFRFHGQYPV